MVVVRHALQSVAHYLLGCAVRIDSLQGQVSDPAHLHMDRVPVCSVTNAHILTVQLT